MYVINSKGGKNLLKIKAGERMKGKILKFSVIIFALMFSTNIFLQLENINVEASDSGLVAYWSFDNQYDLLNDDSGNNHDGTNYGASWISNGVSGGALYFDGIDDYVEIEDYQDFEFGQNDDFTINFWRIDYDDGASDYIACSQDHNAGYYSGWSVHNAYYAPKSTWGDGVGFFITEDSSQVETLTEAIDDYWHLITITKNGNILKLYIDGVEKDSGTISSPYYEDHNLVFGANINDGVIDPDIFFNGCMDEIRIYNRALSNSEIEEIYDQDKFSESDDKLVAYWSFDEGSGIIAHDSSVYSNHGTIYGASWVNGIFGKALEFDGIDDYVYAENPFNNDQSFSLSIWFKPNNLFNHRTLIATMSAKFDIEDFELKWDKWHNGFEFFTRTSDGSSDVDLVKTEAITETDVWYHIVCVSDSEIGGSPLGKGALKIYVNGILVDDTPEDAVCRGGKNWDFLTIGSNDRDYFWDGSIDEVRIYNYPLSADEIIELYGKYTPIFYEDWNDGIIDVNEWNYIDNIIASHGGHKTSISNGELYINAYNDWTQWCGIVTKNTFNYGTTVTLNFRIESVRVHNNFQSILNFMESGKIDENGYFVDDVLFSLNAGNNNNKNLFIKDADNKQYSLGSYIPDKDYSLEVEFGTTNTQISVNNYEITIQRAYPQYSIHFGGHVHNCYFDNININQISEEVTVEQPDFYIFDDDISFSDSSPTIGEIITIYASIHNQGLVDGTANIYFTDMYGTLIGYDSISVEAGGSSIASVNWEIPDIESYSVDVTIDSVNTDENKVYNNFASANLSDSMAQRILAITLGVSNIVPIEENFSRTIPVTIYCYNNPATNVYVKLLDDANLSIEPITPFLNMNPGDKLDYLIKIEYPELEKNVSYAGRTILLQAVGDNGTYSNTESIDVLGHESIETPGFGTVAILAATGLGALVAFFRRRYGNG